MISEIKKRRSIRKYKRKEIPEQDLKEILKAGAYAPSARHRYPYELIVVKDEDMRKKLSETTPYGSFLAQAPVGVVVASEEVEEWIEDASVVAENIQLEATNQGLGSCWIQIRGHTKEGRESEEIVKEKLNIPRDKRVECIITLGYPDEDQEPHSSDELNEREVYLEKHGNEY